MRKALGNKKIRKKNDCTLQKVATGVIVIALSVWTHCVYAVEKSFSAEDGAAASVRVRLGDAARLREQSRVRRSLAEKDEALRKAKQENLTLRHRNELLQRELLSTSEKLQQQNEINRALQYVVAGTLANGELRKTGDREGRLLESLRLISTSGQTFAVEVAKFCEQTETLLLNLPIGKVRQLEFRLGIEKLKQSTRKFNTLAGGAVNPSSFAECEILRVDRDLAVVVLSAGSIQGVFPGLNYRCGKARLRVVAVRPYIAGAMLVEGSMDELSPGKKVFSGEENEKQ